jgi:hypothetical protein
MFRWFILPKPTVAAGDIYRFDIKLTQGKVIRFEHLEFIVVHIDNLSLSPDGNDSSAVVEGVVHGGPPSLHAILEDDSASSNGGSSSFPIPRACNVVTSAIHITTTPPQEETPAFQTIPVVLQQTTVPQLNTRPLSEQLMAFQEEQRCAL